MAGMRIGYAISNPTLIKYLNDAKYSFNSYTMNQTSIVCGVEAVKDREYFENGVRKIVETGSGQKKNLQNLDLHIWILVPTLYLQSTRNTMRKSCLRH